MHCVNHIFRNEFEARGIHIKRMEQGMQETLCCRRYPIYTEVSLWTNKSLKKILNIISTSSFFFVFHYTTDFAVHFVLLLLQFVPFYYSILLFILSMFMSVLLFILFMFWFDLFLYCTMLLLNKLGFF